MAEVGVPSKFVEARGESAGGPCRPLIKSSTLANTSHGGAEDFLGQLEHRVAGVPHELSARLSGVTDIDDDEYDWSLNDM